MIEKLDVSKAMVLPHKMQVMASESVLGRAASSQVKIVVEDIAIAVPKESGVIIGIF
ncbi:hypothetical protein BTN50_1042 [Candidatus Enterovibrio altilux]|uniref:Uncharacterized protein n=1 Tax=Candidatus Enterovibrio altilux TaxID=1927128 RepID=A0A291B968_9GAMM|nr:hypothetical protein BTN50_1042 [Candidatus Enterovibrio luxaltus]